MNYQIWGAPAAVGVIQRQAHQLGVIRTTQRLNGARPRRKLAHPIEHAELRENTSRVRGQLQAGPEFLELVRSLVQRNVETCLRQRYGRRKSANSGASDDRAPLQASRGFAQFALGWRARSLQPAVVDEAS